MENILQNTGNPQNTIMAMNNVMLWAFKDEGF